MDPNHNKDDDDEPILEPGEGSIDPYDDEPDEPADDVGIDALADAASNLSNPDREARRASKRLQQDDSGRIDIDLACIGCEYNLRGQLPDGSCPECGAPVAGSVRSDRLGVASPLWLMKLRQATTWLMVAALATLVFACVGFGVSINARFGNPMLISAIQAITTLIQSGLFLVGYYVLTTPEPGALRPRASRGVTRYTIIPGYLLTIPASFMELSDVDAIILASGLMQLAGGILIAIGFFASLVYLRSLARRVPNPSLALQTRIVMWGWIVCLALVVIGVVIAAVLFTTAIGPGSSAGAQSASRILSLAGLVMCPILLGMLVFAIWWFVLIVTYNKSFERAAKASRLHRRAIRETGQAPAQVL